MRRLFVLAAATAAPMFAVLWAEPTGRLSTAPVSAPVLLDGPTAGNNPPPHWIPKQPGHYSLTDWQRVIDSTWGPGLPTADKLAIFDLFWNVIDDSFACFNNLTVNWDSLRTFYRTEVEDTTSRGRFAAIMNHLVLALTEGHTYIRDSLVNSGTDLLPGVPLWAICAWKDVGHFGAGLTPLPDSSLLVYRVAPDHPLGLEPGDLLLGYDRRPWTELLRELQGAQLPVYRTWMWGSTSSSMTHSLLNGAGMNWHLFDTIDIVKYATGDTVHLPTSLLAGDSMHLFATDQLDIPGVPMPATDSTLSVSYGIVSGTRIGYIYCWRWAYNAGTEFYDAVNALVSDTTLKGMIMDFRYNEGGNLGLSNAGLELLFCDSAQTICFSVRSDPVNHFAMKVKVPAWNYVVPGNGVGYNKPIAVLVGPGAASSGDMVAHRMTFHPKVRTFGKSTNTAFSGPTGLSVQPGWVSRYASAAACLASDTTYFLDHREFPVDVPVWHTRDAVVRGEDTVVTAAMAWIDSAAAVAEELEPTTSDRPSLTATVVRGVLALGAVDSRQNTAYSAELLNISGRKVMALKPGANDVRALAPGAYFIREEPQATSLKPQAVLKIILTR
jgi:hypothetical protein